MNRAKTNLEFALEFNPSMAYASYKILKTKKASKLSF
jgi:hypothetical protein